MRRSIVSMVVVSAVVSPLFLGLAGCQVDLSGSVGAKAFYPNKVGAQNDLGDPRKGAYDGSGYSEENSAGSVSGTPSGLRGYKDVDDQKGGK